MFSTAYRMVGLFALCLLVGVVLSGAVGAQPQPAPIVTVDLIATPTEGPVPLTVVFAAMGQPPSDRACPSATYNFNFGDGTTRTSISPIAVHTYTKPGTYQALVIYTAYFLVGTAPPCVPRQALSRPVVIRVLPPLPETWPCVLAPNDAAFAPIADQLAKKLPPSPMPIDPPPDWPELYASQYFKTYINPKYQAIPLPPPPQLLLELQGGALIGMLRALVKFEIIDKGGCIPRVGGPARSYDDARGPFRLAHAPTLGVRLPPELLGKLNWLMLYARDTNADGKIDAQEIEVIIFYPDDKFRSPEEMLKA
ncbi:MAG: PKD domain-containing protein, partial [Candidatus Bipolaricaulota bacterium]|nr:PKD domain-containing protein [Candidatus Bipolaricaulota bacterium]